jgi:hypothetical protein
MNNTQALEVLASIINKANACQILSQPELIAAQLAFVKLQELINLQTNDRPKDT